MKIICKDWNFYSFSDRFYHWCCVCIQLLVWPTMQSWFLVLTWYNKGWMGSVGRMQRTYCIEISGDQFIPEIVVFVFIFVFAYPLSLISWIAIIKGYASWACSLFLCVPATSPQRLHMLPLPSFLFLMLSFFVFSFSFSFF